MKKVIGTGIILTLVIAGCATTRITTWWKAENTVALPYHKVMVLALIRTADRSIQENMENHMVGDLKDLGYNAVSSLQEYGPKAFDKMDEATALKNLKDKGVDAVITIVMLNKQRERAYVPSTIYYSPYGYYHGRFWDYRVALYNRIYEPGYYVTNTRYFWESNLYQMADQKLVYSVQTQSFNPGDSESLGHEYGKLIIQNMVQHNVLQEVRGQVLSK
jgi:hypothetical protein